MSSSYQQQVYSDLPEQKDKVKNEILRSILDQFCKTVRSNILDVGCGAGYLLAPYVARQNCFGVDVTEKLVAEAEKKGLTAYRVDLENDKLPFPDGFFDFVVCSEVIEHVVNTDNLLGEVHRVLKHGRTLLLTFPNINQPISWAVQILFDLTPVYAARYKSPHVRDYTLKLMKNALNLHGFKVQHVRGTYVYPSQGKLSRWIAKNIPRISEKIIIHATKHAPPQKTAVVILDTRLLQK